MALLFHFTREPRALGSLIVPGNFGLIIRQQGQAHPLFRREMIYEDIRRQRFRHRPSRLDCLFCFPTLEEAALCRAHINGYSNSVLYEVETTEPDFFVADMNNGIQHFDLLKFNLDTIVYYWNGWVRSPDPKAVILREVLLRGPAKVVGQI
ncbi:MAG TPA: DUF2441 domain-containing protein [Methylocella sp.]|nr:DUF2441 domain-containing protein [Methylocella sp.]